MSRDEQCMFNYCIGHYWSEAGAGVIGVYTYINAVQYGSLKEAKELLEYVKKKSPNYDWKIFNTVELKD